MQIISGVLLILHGLVHLLYFGQSARFFSLKPDLAWPDGSWAFSKQLGDNNTRILASVLLILAATGFVIGALGIFFDQSWWRPVVVASAVMSVGLFVLLWNGRLEHLDTQGGIGVLIDGAILVAVLAFGW